MSADEERTGAEKLHEYVAELAERYLDEETPFERLRRLHGEMMNRDKPRLTLTLIQGGRDAR